MSILPDTQQLLRAFRSGAVALCLMTGGKALAANVDYDRAYKDLQAVAYAGSTLPFSDWKLGPVWGLFGDNVRRTRTNYLSAVEAPLESFWQRDGYLSFSGNSPDVSDAFKNVLKDLGMDQQDPEKRLLFMRAFDSSFTDVSELQDESKRIAAVEAGLVAVAGSREKYREVLARHFTLTTTPTPAGAAVTGALVPFDQLSPEARRYFLETDEIESIRKIEEERVRREAAAGGVIDQPAATPFIDAQTGTIQTHGGDAGQMKADCLTEKLSGVNWPDVDTCVRKKLAGEGPSP